jgi:hypothetical protein
MVSHTIRKSLQIMLRKPKMQNLRPQFKVPQMLKVIIQDQVTPLDLMIPLLTEQNLVLQQQEKPCERSFRLFRYRACSAPCVAALGFSRCGGCCRACSRSQFR